MAHWYRGVLHPWKVCMGWVGFWETVSLQRSCFVLLVDLRIFEMFVKNVNVSSVLLVVEILLPGNNTRVCLRHVPVLPVEECTPPGFLSILIFIFIIYLFLFLNGMPTSSTCTSHGVYI